MPDLWFASFRLVNNGDTPISRGDFDRPIALQLTGGEFLDLIVGDSLPLKLKPKLVQISDDTIEIQPILLNAGDSIFFSLFATASMDTLVPDARIAGVDRLDLISSVEENVVRPFSLPVFAYALIVLTMITSGYAGYFLAHRQRARRRIEELLVEAVAREEALKAQAAELGDRDEGLRAIMVQVQEMRRMIDEIRPSQ